MPTAMPPSVKSALRARIGGQLSTAANAGAVVEDMAVAIADAVAQVYLAEARQGREGGAYINTRDR